MFIQKGESFATCSENATDVSSWSTYSEETVANIFFENLVEDLDYFSTWKKACVRGGCRVLQLHDCGGSAQSHSKSSPRVFSCIV